MDLNQLEQIFSQAKFLLNDLIGIDQIEQIPVGLCQVGSEIGIIPIIDGIPISIFVKDKHYPLIEKIYKQLQSEYSNSFYVPNSQDKKVLNDISLYDLIRPPMSGRTVYASENDKFVITFDTLSANTMELGKPYLIFLIDGMPVFGIAFKDSDAGHYLIISDKGYAHCVKKLPIGIHVPQFNVKNLLIPDEDNGQYVVVSKDLTIYYDKPGPFGEEFFKLGDPVFFSNYTRFPLISKDRYVFPVGYKKVFLPICDLGPDAFVTNSEYLSNLLSNECITIHYVGAKEYKLNGELMSYEDALDTLMLNHDISQEKAISILKEASEKEVIYAAFKNSLLKANKSDSIKELLDSYDAQVRYLLKLHLQGKNYTQVFSLVKELTELIKAYLG
ncbi:MAG: hypothetical protein QXW35_04365 [Candidatus Aenigmatarchaeota archaeon]